MYPNLDINRTYWKHCLGKRYVMYFVFFILNWFRYLYPIKINLAWGRLITLLNRRKIPLWRVVITLRINMCLVNHRNTTGNMVKSINQLLKRNMKKVIIMVLKLKMMILYHNLPIFFLSDRVLLVRNIRKKTIISDLSTIGWLLTIDHNLRKNPQ